MKRTDKIILSQLHVRKQVTSRIRLWDGHDHEILIILKSAFLLNWEQHYQLTFRTKYSRVDQVKFVEDSL